MQSGREGAIEAARRFFQSSDQTFSTLLNALGQVVQEQAFLQEKPHSGDLVAFYLAKAADASDI